MTDLDDVPIRYLVSALSRRSADLVGLLVEIRVTLDRGYWPPELTDRLDEAINLNKASGVGRVEKAK